MISIAEHLSSRQMTWDAAARKSGLSPERLRQVDSGAEPTLGEMRLIAKMLRVPLSAFTEQAPPEPIKMLFRQTLEQRDVAKQTSIELLSAQIRDVLAFASDLPTDLRWLDAFRGMDPRTAPAESFATVFRKLFSRTDALEPLQNLSQIAAELGIFILFCRDSTIEGVSAIVDNRAFIFVGARTFAPRMLFTLGHELGHLVAHHSRAGENFALFDSELDGNTIEGGSSRQDEKFADSFASSLLLPREGVIRFLRSVRSQLQSAGPLGDIEILCLARFYNLGFEVTARRCEQLGLLPRNGARALYQKLTDEFGNPEKRADALELPPRDQLRIDPSPVLLRHAVKKIRSGSMSMGKAAELLNMPATVLFAAHESFSSPSQGYLA